MTTVSEVGASLAAMIRCLVDAPEAVRVTPLTAGTLTVFEVAVAPPDVGKVIGREGRTITALRTLLGCVAAQWGSQVLLELVDPLAEGRQRARLARRGGVVTGDG